jgi:hypothetical protein
MGCISFLKTQKFPAKRHCCVLNETQRGDAVTGVGLRIKAQGLIFNLVAMTSLHLSYIYI